MLSSTDLSAALAQAPNTFARQLSRGRTLSPDSPFPFACRGCGQLCCTNQDILVLPPEAWRINWSLARQGREHILPVWGDTFLGSSTGLPVRMIRFFRERRTGETICPFALEATMRRGQRSRGRPDRRLQLCAIREARPVPCRLYPLGRVRMVSQSTGATEQVEYRVVRADCPGWKNAAAGEPVCGGYAPAPADQTVASWIAEQIPAWVEEEQGAYLQVLNALMAVELHAPTDDARSGWLSENLALNLIGPLLYVEPPAPADPAADHDTVMARLADLVKRVTSAVEPLLSAKARA